MSTIENDRFATIAISCGSRQDTLMQPFHNLLNGFGLCCLALPVMLFPTSLRATSFDCALAKSTVEKMICADTELSRLDDHLEKLYRKILDSSKDASTVRAQQRKWLKTNRNVCSEIPCLKAAYEGRMSELDMSQLISDETILAVCKQVVKLANSRQIEKQLISFAPPSNEDNKRYPQPSSYYLSGIAHIDLYHTGHVHDIGRIEGGGTCSSDAIVDLNAWTDLKDLPRDPGEDDENYRWAGWGRGDNLIFVYGEPIIVTADFRSRPSDITLVSSFRDGGPICALERGDPIKIVVTQSHDAALCKAVAKQQIKFKTWVKNDDRAPYQVVDIANEGIPVNIGIEGEASGAGCGSSTTWLTQLTQDRMADADTLLSKELRQFTGPLYPQSDEDIKLFEFRGKPYILAKGKNSSLAVYSGWNSEPKTWCELDQFPTYSIKRRYYNGP